MIRTKSDWGTEEKEVTCFAEKECIFHLIRWTDQIETTVFGGDKAVQLTLYCDDEDIEIVVEYKIKDEDEKDKVFDILTKFLEEMDGQKIKISDYNSCHIDKTKFPVIEGVERIWAV